MTAAPPGACKRGAGMGSRQRGLVEIGLEGLGRPQYAGDNDPFGLAGWKVGARICPERPIKLSRIVLVILPTVRHDHEIVDAGPFSSAVSCVAVPASIAPRSSNSSQSDGIPPWSVISRSSLDGLKSTHQIEEPVPWNSAAPLQVGRRLHDDVLHLFGPALELAAH